MHVYMNRGALGQHPTCFVILRWVCVNTVRKGVPWKPSFLGTREISKVTVCIFWIVWLVCFPTMTVGSQHAVSIYRPPLTALSGVSDNRQSQWGDKLFTMGRTSIWMARIIVCQVIESVVLLPYIVCVILTQRCSEGISCLYSVERSADARVVYHFFLFWMIYQNRHMTTGVYRFLALGN